jgi:hypothetical protein
MASAPESSGSRGIQRLRHPPPAPPRATAAPTQWPRAHRAEQQRRRPRTSPSFPCTSPSFPCTSPAAAREGDPREEGLAAGLLLAAALPGSHRGRALETTVGAALLLPRAGAMDTELHLRAGELNSADRRRSLKAWPPSAMVDPLSSKAERRGGGQHELESAEAGEGKGRRGGAPHPKVEGHPAAAGRVRPDEELLGAAAALRPPRGLVPRSARRRGGGELRGGERRSRGVGASSKSPPDCRGRCRRISLPAARTRCGLCGMGLWERERDTGMGGRGRWGGEKRERD